MRQLGGGGKELAVGAGAEAVGAAGAVEAGVTDGAWREVGAGAGAGTGVRVGAEEAEACVEAGDGPDLEPLLGASSDWPPLKNQRCQFLLRKHPHWFMQDVRHLGVILDLYSDINYQMNEQKIFLILSSDDCEFRY